MPAIRIRFIPFRKAEIVELLCEIGRLSEEDSARFRSFCQVLESLYHFEFHQKIERLKRAYYPFNPDNDTKTTHHYPPHALAAAEAELVRGFGEILANANYDPISEEDFERALAERSLFKISLFVDKGDFANLVLFSRGRALRKATIRDRWYRLFRKIEVDVPIFKRVAMLIRFKGADYFEGRKHLPFSPGGMVIKLFKDIPCADLEMLFPNTQVRMKRKDKVVMGVPALFGLVGITIKFAAIGGAIGALIVVLGAMIGLTHRKPGAGEMQALVAGGTAAGAVGGFLARQWGKYKNQRLTFMKTLADNLYFKNLDNNAGVFHHIVDAAEEEECKEAMLAYFFLLISDDGLTEAALDGRIEGWFEQAHDTLIDFEVDDALRKLKELELCRIEPVEGGQPTYRAIDLEAACERLDYIWDNYFRFNV